MRDWVFLCKWGSEGLLPWENYKKKRMQMVHSETILADSVPVFFSLEFYLCISKFGHKSDMNTRIGIWTGSFPFIVAWKVAIHFFKPLGGGEQRASLKLINLMSWEKGCKRCFLGPFLVGFVLIFIFSFNFLLSSKSWHGG